VYDDGASLRGSVGNLSVTGGLLLQKRFPPWAAPSWALLVPLGWRAPSFACAPCDLRHPSRPTGALRIGARLGVHPALHARAPLPGAARQDGLGRLGPPSATMPGNAATPVTPVTPNGSSTLRQQRASSALTATPPGSACFWSGRPGRPAGLNTSSASPGCQAAWSSIATAAITRFPAPSNPARASCGAMSTTATRSSHRPPRCTPSSVRSPHHSP
jgi:hypothetical protein